MGSLAARLGLGLLCVVAACKSPPPTCDDDTVLLLLTHEGITRSADGLRVRVMVGDGGFEQEVQRAAGNDKSTVELAFAPGVLTGKRVAITTFALFGGDVIGEGAGSVMVTARCATLPITLAPREVDASMPADLAEPPDLTMPDLTLADLTPPPDLALPLPVVKGHWAFDEAAGNTANDASANANNGTIVNATRIVPGKTGAGALQFNGTNTYVSLGTPPSLTITGAMTLSAWVYIDSFAGSGRILAKAGGPTARGWSLGLESTGVAAFIVALDATTAVRVESLAGALVTGKWIHLVGVFQPGVALRMYVDGVLNNSNTIGIPATHFNPALPVYIGRRDDGTYFNGRIDEVRIYDVAFDAAQAAALRY